MLTSDGMENPREVVSYIHRGCRTSEEDVRNVCRGCYDVSSRNTNFFYCYRIIYLYGLKVHCIQVLELFCYARVVLCSVHLAWVFLLFHEFPFSGKNKTQLFRMFSKSGTQSLILVTRPSWSKRIKRD